MTASTATAWALHAFHPWTLLRAQKPNPTWKVTLFSALGRASGTAGQTRLTSTVPSPL